MTTEYIPIDQIVISQDRQRKHFDEIELSELANDILANGLYHPPVVRVEGAMMILVAGERRLRALKSLAFLEQNYLYNDRVVPAGFVPVNNIGVVSHDVATEIELHENIKRQDITWQERVDAESRLIELRRDQAMRDGKPAPSLASIAAEANTYPNPLRESEIIAKHLDNPTVAKAADKKAAMKAVERIRQETYNRNMAKELNQSKPESRHTFIQGDAMIELGSIPSETFDCILTDPPYFVGADTMGAQANANGRDYDDSPGQFTDFMLTLAEETYRLAKPDAHGYIFCSIERFWDLSAIFDMAGWDVWPRPLIWHKGNLGAAPRPDFGPRYTYEAILYIMKGDRRVNDLRTDVLTYPGVMSRLHPDEKPVGLYEDLLRRSCNVGDTVLDPCGGSGTTFAAANRLTLTATVIEQSELYSGIALQRINSQE